MKNSRRERPGLSLLAGLVTIALLGGVAVLAFRFYKGDINPGVRVTIRADRAGLLMDPGSEVSLRGVRVGTVRTVTSQQDHAVIVLDLKPSQAQTIPANVQADLEPTTLFGAKFVDLVLPAHAAPAGLRTGDVVRERAHALETDQVFQNVMNLLAVVQPQKINDTLTAISGALAGRGEQIGQTVTEFNTYLTGLLPSVPQLNQDLALADRLLPTYTQAAPDLVQAMDNFRTTSKTVTGQQQPLTEALGHLTTSLGDTTALLIDAGPPLTGTVRYLDTTAATLDRYAPELTCLLQGMANVTEAPRLNNPLKYPGVWTNTALLPAAEPYQYPRDLPKVAADAGPHCYGLPLPNPADPPPHYAFDVGPSPYKNSVPIR